VYDVLVTDDFAFRAEVDEFLQVNLHMEVSNWTPRVAREVKKVFKDAMEAFRLEGFGRMYTITPNPKFVKRMAGGEDRGAVDYNGTKHQIIVWELEG